LYDSCSADAVNSYSSSRIMDHGCEKSKMSIKSI